MYPENPLQVQYHHEKVKIKNKNAKLKTEQNLPQEWNITEDKLSLKKLCSLGVQKKEKRLKLTKAEAFR